MVFEFAGGELDLDRYELRRDGQVVRVEPQVFDLLAVLLRLRQRVVSKEELLDAVWGNRFVTESALTSRVKAARRAIGDDGRGQRLIRTVHGRGYQFVGTVIERATAGTAVSAPAPPSQQIRFCTARDGTRLGYALTGAGAPLVKAANWLSHLDYDWESPVWRHWLGELSSRFQLLRYDERGCGLSDWDVERFAFDDWVEDLETVVDAAGLQRFPLLGISQGGPVAIAYAVRHPERVSHLVLLGSFAQGRRKRATTQEEAQLADARVELVRLGWGRPDPTYRATFVARFLPEGTQEQWRAFDELQRRSTSAANAWRFLDAFADIDVADLAPRVTAPTLVLCARREPDSLFEQSRTLAALIPGSRLVSLDSANHLLPEQDPAWPHFLSEIDAFLGSAAEEG
ncbi:alpha/beta fold hydrolase [Acrocarpospora macrocephala]|uniref:Transcriptional regulator n=1 Tax=Acrocarpospora macrocephala TaxID=150177 RepID=A0A5M3WXI6_9ACTN|nr:alpha/beta fold hydrolase [Acrocarpospora macrocephala]GES12031.1 transcriptional regulator [Acrocarpospora macrocephala]